jgi:hypothetical protein
MLSKKFIIPMAAVALIVAGAYGVTKASAASDGADPQASLIQKLADTFHLDKSKVQAVFDQNRDEHQAAREKNYEDRLTQAVTDGKITSSQKDLILTEHNKLEAELKADRTAGDTKTRAEHRAAMDKIHAEAEAWATANNIDAKWLVGPGGPGHMRGGMGGPMGHPRDNDADDTASPSPTTTPGA